MISTPTKPTAKALRERLAKAQAKYDAEIARLSNLQAYGTDADIYPAVYAAMKAAVKSGKAFVPLLKPLSIGIKRAMELDGFVVTDGRVSI